MLGLLACSEDPLSFSDEPRPCEELGEVCPTLAPTLIELADLDGDGAAELTTVGLGWELSVASLVDGEYTYATTRVPVAWGSQLSSCSSGAGSNDLVLYQHGDEWWVWRLSNGRLELVDSGHPSLTSTVACFDLGPSADAIAILDETTLMLPTVTFELQSLGSTWRGMASMPTADGTKFSLFAFVIPNPEPYVATFDLEAGTLLTEDTWPLNLGRIDALAVGNRDVAVAGRTDGSPELVIVRNVDPVAPVPSEVERLSLPWQASLLETAELDGDSAPEFVMSPVPVTAVAVYGLAESQTGLDVLDLEFEAIDIATGDHDGDGTDEIYALDPREERIIEISAQSG